MLKIRSSVLQLLKIRLSNFAKWSYSSQLKKSSSRFLFSNYVFWTSFPIKLVMDVSKLFSVASARAQRLTYEHVPKKIRGDLKKLKSARTEIRTLVNGVLLKAVKKLESTNEEALNGLSEGTKSVAKTIHVNVLRTIVDHKLPTLSTLWKNFFFRHE